MVKCSLHFAKVAGSKSRQALINVVRTIAPDTQSPLGVAVLINYPFRARNSEPWLVSLPERVRNLDAEAFREGSEELSSE